MMLENLTCGERLVRCFLGQPIDRVPFGIGIGWRPWAETLERWRCESGNKELAPAKELGFDADFAIPSLNLGIFPKFETVVIEETDDFVIHRDEHGVTKRDRRDRGSIPEFLDYPVKTADDWERLKAERLRIDQPGRVWQDWGEFHDRLKQTGQAVQVGEFPNGVFGTVRDLMGVEATLMGFYDTPELVRDIMEHMTTLWISVWQQVSEQVQIDHIHIWEDMSGKQGSLISPVIVEKFMMPCYDRIVEFGKSAGVRIVSVDTDGDCSELVPIMMAHGVNMMFPFEVQAGNDICQYRQMYPELGIIGGLDKRALVQGKEAIDIEVEKAEQVCKMGRYVPAFDHVIPPDVPWESFCYAAERIREVCCGL